MVARASTESDNSGVGGCDYCAPALAIASAGAASPAKGSSSTTLRVQVLLDRAHFSPGEIDGRYGANTRRAVAAFNKAHGLKGGEKVGKATLRELGRDEAPTTVPYLVSQEDVTGAFEKLPVEPADKAKLDALGFESPLEGIAERFHVSPRMLRSLNPGVEFDRAGVEIKVPNVERHALAAPRGLSVRVSVRDRSVEALASSG